MLYRQFTLRLEVSLWQAFIDRVRENQTSVNSLASYYILKGLEHDARSSDKRIDRNGKTVRNRSGRNSRAKA